jgi:ferredoxin
MQAVSSRTARARAKVYYALADVLADPTRESWEWLLDAVLIGARLLGSAGCQRAMLALLKGRGRSSEALAESYARLLASRGCRPIPLYESLHRQGTLMGQHARDVERQYRALGLSPADGELPDHASVELTFLGHLAAAEADARAAGDGRLVARLRLAQRHFLRTHAGAWLPDVGARLAAVDDPFFAAVGNLLSEFLSEELAGRTRNGGAPAGVPTLIEPATCTLCGLCVGSCTAGALRVIETHTETSLVLDPARCTGCGRCEGVCPEQTLELSSVSSYRAPATNGRGQRVLRQSRRAACPGCGRPTVSQAELEAVFARLQPDAVRERRMCLCIDCKSWTT